MRAWFLNGSNSKRLKNAEVLTPTATSKSYDSEKEHKKKKSSNKTSSRRNTDKTIELLTKQIEKLTAQRLSEPSKGEKWCTNCRMSNHSTEECKQCDFCAGRGHL